MAIITIGAHVEGVSSRKDNTMKITFGTSELMPSAAGDLFSLQNQFCYLAIKPEPFRKEEEMAIAALETGSVEENFKTPSQRLRAVLYRLWQQQPDGFPTFAQFYDSRMEQVVTQIKNKLT